MKPKKFKNKMSLNKRTVSHLSDGSMKRVVGGATVGIECLVSWECPTAAATCLNTCECSVTCAAYTNCNCTDSPTCHIV
ncbi:MAG: class I lanthipeptide [Candidatus Peribacteraceae bacterium]|nr:class I lanthipeptide [Candidatus Peribacteraceae bacterium]